MRNILFTKGAFTERERDSRAWERGKGGEERGEGGEGRGEGVRKGRGGFVNFMDENISLSIDYIY